ncbi:hypothetical protein V6N11_082798 [Hibiscus sabdariffa]|uniref:RNase H type-1 domain-containing protein n=1 Tax=Hibiscus sabdariffa TaxID=183260 RepID=A0ABR2QK58_9ROSI
MAEFMALPLDVWFMQNLRLQGCVAAGYFKGVHAPRHLGHLFGTIMPEFWAVHGVLGMSIRRLELESDSMEVVDILT